MPFAASHTDQFEPRKASALVVDMQQDVPRQVLRTLERARAIGGKLGAAHRQESLAEQAHGAVRRHRLGTIPYGQVDALAIEVDDAIVRGDEHVDGGMAGAKARQPRDQPYRRERLIGRDGQRQRRLLATNLGHRLRDLVEHAPGGCLQDLAGTGQAQLSVPALEQRKPDLLFERLHLAGQRRLRQKQLLGGASERKLARRRLEALEQIQRWQTPTGARLG